MAEKTIAPGMKFALEFGPIIAFFALYLWLRDETFLVGGVEYSGFIAVTAAFVPLLALSTYILYRLTGKLARMQIVTLVLVVVFGGLTIWFNDERFFKMKPTMIYLLFGGVLGFGLLRGTSYLRFAMEELMPLQDEGWMKLTRRITLFFFALAAANAKPGEVVLLAPACASFDQFASFEARGDAFRSLAENWIAS